MKHIKKKFLNQSSLADFENNNENNFDKFSTQEVTQAKLRSVKKTSEAIIFTDEYAIKSFLYNDKKSGITVPVPEPDPVLIYFDYAQNCYSQLTDKKSELIKTLNPEHNMDEDMEQKVFSFIGLASSCIIFLSTSLEAFLNQIIPDDFLYHKPLANKTEVYDKSQIQRNLTLKEKFKTIVPNALKMEDFKDHQVLYKGISNLIDLRNNLIHTKDEKGVFKYANFSAALLNHDYNNSISTVRDAINHFKPNYIEECGCGNDF